MDNQILDLSAFLAAKKQVMGGEYSLVIIPRQGKPLELSGKGVRSLLSVMDSQPEVLRGALVVDKIIGKAAAAVLVLGGAAAVFGCVMSSSAHDFLRENGIAVRYGQLVDRILNRTGDDCCPIEKIALLADSAETACQKIRDFIAAAGK